MEMSGPHDQPKQIEVPHGGLEFKGLEFRVWGLGFRGLEV